MTDGDNFYYAAYNGSKNFSQKDVKTAEATGFGAAADDYAERGIDLNEQLIKNKPATFFLRVNSNAMVGAGIRLGDVAVVDRSLKPKNGKVVIAIVEGELVIRKLELTDKQTALHTVEKKATVAVIDRKALRVWGVVTSIIHTL